MIRNPKHSIPLKKSSPEPAAPKGKFFPFKASYRAFITLLKDEYEKYLYYCRTID